MDHNPDEVRSKKIYNMAQGWKHFTEPKRDAEGKVMTSYNPGKKSKPGGVKVIKSITKKKKT